MCCVRLRQFRPRRAGVFGEYFTLPPTDYKFPMIWSQGNGPSLSILKDTRLVVFVNKDDTSVLNHAETVKETANFVIHMQVM